MAVAGTLALPRLALVFVGGAAYAAVQPDLWLFAVLGTVIAMIQLLVQTALARAHRHAVWWIWGALATVRGGRSVRRHRATPCCCSSSASTPCCSPCSCASPGPTVGRADRAVIDDAPEHGWPRRRSPGPGGTRLDAPTNV